MAQRQVESVYRIVDVVGESATSWEEAGRHAVETASTSIRDLRVAEVVKMDMKIEDGKVTVPVRDATLIGNGPEALKYVSMVGHDLKLDEGIGTCGKDGQSVPVGVGMPTIKLDRMTVGGTGR